MRPQSLRDFPFLATAGLLHRLASDLKRLLVLMRGVLRIYDSARRQPSRGRRERRPLEAWRPTCFSDSRALVVVKVNFRTQGQSSVWPQGMPLGLAARERNPQVFARRARHLFEIGIHLQAVVAN